MERRIILGLIFCLCCSGPKGQEWVNELKGQYPMATTFILIPLENSCSSCQGYVGNWLATNHERIVPAEILIILSGQERFTLQDYQGQFLSAFPQVFLDRERKYLKPGILEGSYPYYKIKMVRHKNGQPHQATSLESGPEEEISNQLETFFLK